MLKSSPLPVRIDSQQANCYLLKFKDLFKKPLDFTDCLSRKELAEAESIKDQNHYRTVLYSRAALRTVLSRYCGMFPRDIIFKQKKYGKPYIKNSDLNFNLSHSHGLLFIAVSGGELGVDCESGFEHMQIQQITGFTFADHPAKERINFIENATELKKLTLRTWTEKEALAKAIGLGLSLDFSKCSWSKISKNSYAIDYQNQTYYSQYLGLKFGCHLSLCSRVQPENFHINLFREI